MSKTIIFPYPFEEQCDMALCDKPKIYTIAAEGGHPSLFFGICEYHMESLLEAIVTHPKLGPMMAEKIKEHFPQPEKEVAKKVEETKSSGNKASSPAKKKGNQRSSTKSSTRR